MEMAPLISAIVLSREISVVGEPILTGSLPAPQSAPRVKHATSLRHSEVTRDAATVKRKRALLIANTLAVRMSAVILVVEISKLVRNVAEREKIAV